MVLGILDVWNVKEYSSVHFWYGAVLSMHRDDNNCDISTGCRYDVCTAV